MPNRKFHSRYLIIIALILVAAFTMTASAVFAAGYGNVIDTAPEHVEYTRVIERADGSLFASATYWYTEYLSTLRFYESTDGGATFSFVSEFADPLANADPQATTGSLVIGTQDMIELPDGSLILAYVRWVRYDQAQGLHLEIYKSYDDGVTWDYTSTMETNATWQWEPEFVITPDNNLQIYYSFTGILDPAWWVNLYAQEIAHRESTDGGLTWSERNIVVTGPNLGVGMPRVAKVSDTEWYMAFEWYGDSTAVHVIHGTDGKTWDPCCGHTMESSTGWAISTPVLTYANGALIGMGKNYLQQQSFDEHPHQGKVLLYSTDGGVTWDEMAAPFVIPYTGDGWTNWSPDLLVRPNNQLGMISNTDDSGRPNDIRYGAADILFDFDFQTFAGPIYKLVNRNSGMVIGVEGGSVGMGANMVQWYDTGSPDQQWHVRDLGNGYVYLYNKNSERGLGVWGGGTYNGAQAVQWAENYSYDQQWQIVPVEGSYYKLVNRNSNKVLGVSGGATYPGAQVVQWDDYTPGSLDQQWELVLVNDLPTIDTVDYDNSLILGESSLITVLATDPDSDPLLYSFDCDGDGAFEVDSQTNNETICKFAAVGEHTVHVQVDDGTFTVTDSVIVVVQSHAEAIEELRADLQVLNDAGILNHGDTNGLDTKLKNAARKLEQGQLDGAIHQLNVFIEKVNEYVVEGLLTAEEAQPLINAAYRIIAAIEATI